MSEYKVIVKEVLKFRDGTSEERTVLERSTSDLQRIQDSQLEWEKEHNPHHYPKIVSATEPITLFDLLDDIQEEASVANREPWE